MMKHNLVEVSSMQNNYKFTLEEKKVVLVFFVLCKGYCYLLAKYSSCMFAKRNC